MTFREKMRLVADYEQNGKWIHRYTCHGGRNIGKFLRIQSKRYVKNILKPWQRHKLMTSTSFLYFVILYSTKTNYGRTPIKQYHQVLRNQTVPAFSNRVFRSNG